MSDTRREVGTWLGVARWTCLGAAVVALVVFLVSQRAETIDVSYAQSPTSPESTRAGKEAGLSDASVPPVEELVARLQAERVVRLPGAVAHWDEARVDQAIGNRDARILVAPPGLDEAERKQISEAKSQAEKGEREVVTIVGTTVSGGILEVAPSTLDERRAEFAVGDVTGLIIYLLGHLWEQPVASGPSDFRWREPTAAELAPVEAALRSAGRYTAEGATLTEVPHDAARQAFDGAEPLVAAFPRQPFGEPVPDYGAALTARFPDRPIVVLYGLWVSYHGPNADAFADVAAASTYAQFGRYLSSRVYPQDAILGVYLDRVIDIRYAGLFDRPLPYQPPDPLRVTLPALPWVFAGCVAVFVALSARAVRKPRGLPRGTSAGARLGALTALAIEVSGLTDGESDVALTLALAKLESAREALEEGRDPDAFLTDAHARLDEVARLLGRTDYRPDVYVGRQLA
ncbi:hypothetical protein [Amycolatopsis albispora]|uniref:Uncharacterized protein n=1 Tax=Amycolatopsis albispora TaxID=1804986 RepID=A0A344LGM4_9PSEU|nr:hypothetical protein [Amycolatopsis albispora]AXB47198.1 hypothetical protein A4R43_36065 [Amycolatopsis albispora]